jgi:hypothetical protein
MNMTFTVDEITYGADVDGRLVRIESLNASENLPEGLLNQA